MTDSCPECGHTPVEFKTFVNDGYWTCPECDWIVEDHEYPVGTGEREE
jgi:ribosomal protein L37AE/L43A